MKKIVFTIACLFVLVIPSSANSAQSRLYDCAANSLYVFCSLTGNKISYSRSLELLPITKKGNSMLEFNNALKQCGYTTQAKIIKPEDLVKIKTPFVVLNNTKEDNDGIGHFFIMIPNDGILTIYDHPKEIQTYPADFLESVLKQKGINEIPIIMCELKKPIDENNTRDTFDLKKAVHFRNFNEKLIGQLDFGNIAEGGLLKCAFTLTNKSPDSITIQEIKADCKCSEIEIDKTHLNPGDTSTISLEISLAHRYKETTIHGWGRIAKSDGSQATNLLLFVKGYSEPRVLLKPQKIKFGYIKTNSGSKIFKDAKITKTQYAKNKPITKIKSTASNVKISNLRYNGDVTLFDVFWDSKESIGLKNSKIEVFLGNQEESASYFDISAFFQMEFSISPQAVIVKQRKTSEVKITSKDRDFVVNGIKVSKSTDLFDLSYNNEEAFSSIFIKLRDKVASRSFIEDIIEVEIKVKNSEDVRLLEVPVIYVSDKP